MRVQRLFTCRMDGVLFASFLSEDIFVVASSDNVIWCKIHDSTVSEIHRSSHAGRSFDLFSIHDHSLAAFQREEAPWSYSLQLLDWECFRNRPVSIPFSWTNQITADISGAILAVFGSVSIPGKAGWIPPIESCLIDMRTGKVQRCSYSAAAFFRDTLFFIQDSTLCKRGVLNPHSLEHVSGDVNLHNPTEVIASDVPSPVISLALMDDRICIVTPSGLYAVSSSELITIHKWESVLRILINGDVCFTRDIGPEIHIFNSKTHARLCITASTNTQVTGFDSYSLSRRDGTDEGLLMIVSEKGVMDLFSWHSV